MLFLVGHVSLNEPQRPTDRMKSALEDVGDILRLSSDSGQHRSADTVCKYLDGATTGNGIRLQSGGLHCSQTAVTAPHNTSCFNEYNGRGT